MGIKLFHFLSYPPLQAITFPQDCHLTLKINVNILAVFHILERIRVEMEVALCSHSCSLNFPRHNPLSHLKFTSLLYMTLSWSPMIPKEVNCSSCTEICPRLKYVLINSILSNLI